MPAKPLPARQRTVRKPAARKAAPKAHALPTLPRIEPAPAPLLPVTTVERLLGLAKERGAELAEVYVEKATTTAVVLDERRIKSAQVGCVEGVGIRAVSGAKVGYAYSDDLDDEALDRTARTAALIASSGGYAQPVKVSRVPVPKYYAVTPALETVEIARKAALLERAERAARAADKRVTQVMGSYVDSTKRIVVANSDGRYAEDTQDLCRMPVSVVAVAKDGERRTGSHGGGGRVPFTHFDLFSPEQIAREAVRQAVATFGAVDAPAGPQTVVLAPGWSGVLLHEAVGHGLEADFIRKGTSLFTGKLGEQVASDKVTVIDDATMANARGSVNVDDEGNPGQYKVLIEKGVLRGYMYDALNAKLMGAKTTGSGRRQSFRHAPLPRMTNTLLAPGDATPEEIVRSVKLGLYAAQLGGGQVDITNGNFVFEVSEAYLIEDGRLTAPVKDATLIGVGPEVLKHVSMVGCDPKPDPGIGTCGKGGQSVPVGVGLPTVRIDGVTVGGTKVAARTMV